MSVLKLITALNYSYGLYSFSLLYSVILMIVLCRNWTEGFEVFLVFLLIFLEVMLETHKLLKWILVFVVIL